MNPRAIEFSDRDGGYSPNPETVCQGPCEGLGCYPVFDPARYEKNTFDERRLWRIAHKAAGKHACDGYHMIPCPACNGTGRRP